jgi:coenzyme PQQ synthesis protein D (PqqD)
MGDMSRYVDRGDDGKSFVTRRIAGETILVPVTGHVAELDSIYTLNEVGSFIWHLIDGRRSGQAIAEAVSAEYDVTLEQALRDVDELLTTLEAKGFSRPLGGGPLEQERDM